ncbi:AAEL005105-PA [Aedes aegypti]|uniref:AAEL005105-PA n=1 Tax=Aedes aegypti TaxID=7159 RepID=Q17B13_AEDAE|nr:AAEL005105-PA [Aedes aegypti]
MAKFLEDELKSSEALLNSPVKHCETCVCPRNANLTSGSLILADLLGDGQKYYSVGTQTVIKGETNNSLCLRCNNNLNSPSHNNSPYIMKLIKSSDSVISETKSSVSDFLTTPDKTSPNNGTDQGILPPAKKDDLMVNPILGHHRITDRSGNYNSTSPNSDPPIQSGLTITKSNSYSSGNGTKLSHINQTKKAQDLLKPKVQSTVSTGSKYTGESPSYIIKDTDQMSGSHALQTPNSGIGGGFGSASSQHNKMAGGSVGSGLYHAVGSTNSLWSRTSSGDPVRDGAKIFESFNRNLIKTIKAENPKMSGPRICSLRIQNGSSNILLDSLQDDVVDDLLESKSSVGPVIYTRRAKFLDEELLLDDDPSIGLNGAIKTTSLPTASASVNNSSNGSKQTSMIVNGSGSGVLSSGHGSGDNQGTDKSRQDSSPKDVCNMSTTTSPNSSDRLCTIGEEVNNLLLNTKITSGLIPNKPRPDINVNKLEGLDLNSKKSCTQSSSISSEIDIQESVMLRRQQLSRVAEWVQNNSKIGNTEHMSNTESDSENLALASAASLTLVDNLNNNASNNGISTRDPKGNFIDAKPIASDIKMSRSSSNSAMAQQISSDNVLSNSNTLNNNHIISSNNNMNTNSFAQANSTNAAPIRGYSHSSLKAAIMSNAAQLNFNNNNHPTYHGNLSNRAMYGSVGLNRECSRLVDDKKVLLEQHERQILDCDLDDSNSVDIAQMEYNVKQFLLKQNEWSSLSRRMSSSTASGTVEPTAQHQRHHHQQQPVVEEPLQRTVSSISEGALRKKSWSKSPRVAD